MIRRVLFIIICVQWIKGYSQRIVVVDSIDKIPLGFVAIKYEGGGEYTNEIGQFNFESVKSNHIQLSLLGYKTKNVVKEQVKDSIFLSPSIVELQEVVITQKTIPRDIVFKPPKKANNFSSFVTQPKFEIILMLYPSESVVNLYLKQVHIPFKIMSEKNDGKSTLKNIDAIVRFNIYSLENKKIRSQLYSSQGIKVDPIQKDEIVLDISDEFIAIHKDGLAIGIEMIGYYDRVYNEISDRGYVRPTLTEKGYKEFKAETFLSYRFKNVDQLVLIGDILKEGGMYKGNFNRNLSIGLTLSKFSY